MITPTKLRARFHAMSPKRVIPFFLLTFGYLLGDALLQIFQKAPMSPEQFACSFGMICGSVLTLLLFPPCEHTRGRKKPPSGSDGLPFDNTVDFAEAMRQLPDKDTAAAMRRQVSNTIRRQQSKPPSRRFNRFTP